MQIFFMMIKEFKTMKIYIIVEILIIYKASIIYLKII